MSLDEKRITDFNEFKYMERDVKQSIGELREAKQRFIEKVFYKDKGAWWPKFNSDCLAYNEALDEFEDNIKEVFGKGLI